MSAPAGGRRIVQERLVEATPERVFAAWSDPASLRVFMCPGDVAGASVELDFRVGGRFRIAMRGRERDFVQHGEYLEIDPPRRLVFSWVSEWLPEDERHSRVRVSFERVGADETRIRLVHDRLPASDGYEGHGDGWASILAKLAGHLAGPVATSSQGGSHGRSRLREPEQ